MRIYYFIITLIISFCVSLQAQNNADKFKQQAQSSFENKDYTKARYLYIQAYNCLLYTSPSPRDGLLSRMPSSA